MKSAATRRPSATERALTRVVTATPLLEGAGFPVRRPVPQAGLIQVDPFLLLDHMGPVDWAPGEALGAPDHPHRGFETVTYLLEGRMQHRDSAGHVAELGPGDVQWMTAGGGIVHSELPHPEFKAAGGRLHGFQIWVNLPSHRKMTSPRYQGRPAGEIPTARNSDGRVTVKVIAGESMGVRGTVDTHNPITYLHFTLQPGATLVQPLSAANNALVYVFAGRARVGHEAHMVVEGQMAMLGSGDGVPLAADPSAASVAELLLLAGRPLGEPVVRHGPFVMNTREQIQEAIRDYQAGRMA